MKLSLALCLLYTCTAIAKIHIPHRISYKDLLKNYANTVIKDKILQALNEVGLISITDIPSYEETKKNALNWMFHECTKDSKSSKIFKYQDGTIRRTLATHTVPGPGGMQKIKHDADDSNKACTSFSKSNADMRSIIDQVTKDFSSVLSSILDIKTPVMETKDGYPFSEFKDVVENGEHLEHFHSYQKNHGSSEDTTRSMDTIETHTDQGLFIVFTPGKIVNEDDDSTSRISDGFYVQLQDGSHAMVDLNEGDLVFMLGDGVQQYINPKILPEGRRHLLRATPHFLRAPSHKENEARVWYGRMVLPPALAYIPEQDMTYGQVRKLITESSNDKNGIHLGCSSSSQIVRHLESETECAEGSIYCWSRCMKYTEYDISPEICLERNLELKCVNPRGQVYVEGHGDYYPDCSNSTEPVTPFPPLPGYPRDESICTEEDWQDFAIDETFDQCQDIGKYNKAKLCYTIIEEGEFIDARLSYNGLFGYISIGFANPGGGKNGMQGASIIMALPGDDYNPADGLDLTKDPTVQEYVISPVYSSFRHWSGPVQGRNTSTYASESTACFSVMTFTTDSINDIPFNITGTDNLIWSANDKDYHVQYHGRDTRDNFYIEWATGKIWQEDTTTTTDKGDEVDNGSHEEDHDNAMTTTYKSFMTTSSATYKSFDTSFFVLWRFILLLFGTTWSIFM